MLTSINYLKETLVGKPYDEAAKIAANLDMQLRPMFKDGEPLIGTMDFRTDRINVAIDDNIVTNVSSIG